MMVMMTMMRWRMRMMIWRMGMMRWRVRTTSCRQWAKVKTYLSPWWDIVSNDPRDVWQNEFPGFRGNATYVYRDLVLTVWKTWSSLHFSQILELRSALFFVIEIWSIRFAMMGDETYICTYIYTYIYIYLHIHIYIYIYKYTNKIYVQMNIHVFYIYTHLYIHYIYTYTCFFQFVTWYAPSTLFFLKTHIKGGFFSKAMGSPMGRKEREADSSYELTPTDRRDLDLGWSGIRNGSASDGSRKRFNKRAWYRSAGRIW